MMDYTNARTSAGWLSRRVAARSRLHIPVSVMDAEPVSGCSAIRPCIICGPAVDGWDYRDMQTQAPG
jgi:hypothetical protein